MVLLSIAINVWPGSDFYRFALLLETYVYRPSKIEDYMGLAHILNGWNPRERTIPDDHFKSVLLENNFKRVVPSKPDEIELILAMDGDIKNAPVEMNLKMEEYFINFCKSIKIHYQIIHKAKIGVCAMRNAAMQTFRGDYLMFRDDDDFSACLEDLHKQAIELKKLGMGTNDPSYWNTILNKQYDDVFQLQRDLWRYQKKPVMAMLLTNVRIKNTWGTKENPFSIVPLPIDTSTAVMVNRPSFFAMWSKVFSRESVPLISNSINLGSLEDSRSFHTQEFPQKSFYVFKDDHWKMFNDGYELFKKYISGEQLPKEDFEQMKYFWKWCNLNLLPYQYSELTLNKQNPNLEMLDKIKQYFINIDVCSGAYTFPSGNYSRNSWSWAALIGTLEAFRTMHRPVDFTILDLQRAHKFISSCLKTELIDVNCVCKVTSLIDDDDAKELAQLFETLTNYRYIYWKAIVNKKSDWEMFEKTLSRMKELLNKIENKGFVQKEGADKIQEQPRHPNLSCEVELVIDNKTETKVISLSNSNIVNSDVDLLRSNYTDRFMPKQSLNGGDGVNIYEMTDDEEIQYPSFDDRNESELPRLFDDRNEGINDDRNEGINDDRNEEPENKEPKHKSIFIDLLIIVFISAIIILIIRILMSKHEYNHGHSSDTKQSTV